LQQAVDAAGPEDEKGFKDRWRIEVRRRLGTDIKDTGVIGDVGNETAIEVAIGLLKKDEYRFEMAGLADCILIKCGLANYCVGSDKFGHFFQQGHMLYEIKRFQTIRALFNSKDPAKYGEMAARAFSEWTEGFGAKGNPPLAQRRLFEAWLESGEFEFYGFEMRRRLKEYHRIWGGRFPLAVSFGDLRANLMGMRFYDWLMATKDPKSFAMKFDICHYIRKQWTDENAIEQNVPDATEPPE
jgi:hypothetical protein